MGLGMRTETGEENTRNAAGEKRGKTRKVDLHPNPQSYHATPQKLQYAQPNSFYTYHIKLLKHLPPNAIWHERKIMMEPNMIRRGGGGLDGI
jgi:hypothetical protein